MSVPSEFWHHFEKDGLQVEKLYAIYAKTNLHTNLQRPILKGIYNVSIICWLTLRKATSSALIPVLPEHHTTSDLPAPGPSTSIDQVANLEQPSNKRQKIMDTYIIKKISKDQKTKINLDLLDLCTNSFHPFSVVEERAFRKLCR